MGLRVRSLELLVMTEAGPHGVHIRFTDGLNVLAAPNTSGKSTAVMSILYALGLEGMLGPVQQPPLPDVMRHSISVDGRELPVTEGRVRLEIENGEGRTITVQRSTTGTTLERQLVRVVAGPDLSVPSTEYDTRDFYVRVSGAVQGESGFHRYLAEFMAYQLPDVPSTAGTAIPLYLECLFPYFFVDQLTGWRDIKARMPTYLRVPEMAKRSAEFILDLDVLQRSIERQKIEQQHEQVKTDWGRQNENARIRLARGSVTARGIPSEPVSLWPPSPAPQLFVTNGDEWVTANAAIANLASRLRSLVDEEIPRAEQASEQALTDLRLAEERIVALEMRLEASTQELMSERSHLQSINQRLLALNEDLRKYLDEKKVRDRGGSVSLKTASGRCPTCDQSIKDALLPQQRPTNPMSLEENIAFIRDQIATFEEMRGDAVGVLQAKEQQSAAVESRIEETSEYIRALRRTLQADGRAPSVAAVQERLQIEHRLKALEDSASTFDQILDDYAELARRWTVLEARLRTLASTELSDEDRKKLDFLETSFIEQLEDYGFTSFPIEQLGISRETYRPTREQFDIGLTSASDTIRIIWAYLLGLLETDRRFRTNHLGMVVFDEPRQQSTDRLSFVSLLRRAAESAESGQQVIFATSEDRASLEEGLSDLPCNRLWFDAKMLRPLGAPSA